MRQRQITTIALAVLLITGGAGTAQPQGVPLGDAVEILGNVTSATQPVGSALVIALNLSSFSSTQTFTNDAGAFQLRSLRNGVYRIIAVKQGFAPAVATVIPNGQAQRVAIRLRNERKLTPREKQDIWEIRSSLPKDVLREIDAVLAPPDPDPARTQQRFAAEMVSMAGMTTESMAPTLTRNAVGLRGDVGGWEVDFRGDMHRLGAPAPGIAGTEPIAESTGVLMEVRSEPGDDAYRFQSTRSSWQAFRQMDSRSPSQSADLEAHNFEWERRGANVQVRYLSQENVFDSSSSSELFEVSGGKVFYDTDGAKLGVSVRIGQENFSRAESPAVLSGPYRLAQLTADGSFNPVEPLTIQYGLVTRFAETGDEVSPVTGFALKLARNLSIIGSGMYKVHDNDEPIRSLPTLVFWNNRLDVAPRYKYSFGVVAGSPASQQFTALVTMAESDSYSRIVFDDRFEQLGDSLYLEPGDRRHDVTVAYSRNVGKSFAVDVSTSAGSARQPVALGGNEKYYVISDLRSLYRPSGTSIEVSYRQIGERGDVLPGTVVARERMNVTMGQSLHLPLDVRVLLGLEFAHLSDLATAGYDSLERRYLGGFSVAF